MLGFSRLLLAALLLISTQVSAAERPRISIIIDDMGDRLQAGNRAIELPGALSYAILPHTPYSRRLAEFANCMGKEVMLHLPMESEQPAPLGPGALTLHMSWNDFRRSIRESLKSIPHASGVNNHMGSLLTRHPGHMQWLMEELKTSGDLFFIDSRTTTQSVAPQIARENGIVTAERKVFLDHDIDPEQIRYQFKRLIRSAHRDGSAIGIGHPYGSTLSVLEEMLPQLAELGVELVPVSSLLQKRSEGETTWQASLSH